MKKALIAVAVSLVAFVIGFAGIYLAMPSIAPATVETAQHQLDSLKTYVFAGDSTLAAMDSLASVLDSLDVAILRADLEQALDSTQNTLDSQKETITLLEDSLKGAYMRLASLESDQSALLEQINGLNERLKTLEAQRVEVQDLSATIPKLKDKELKAILQQLDLNVLEMLYAEASGRNRTKMLQALPADRAANLVNFILDVPTSSGTPTPEESDEAVSTVLTSTEG